MSEGVFPSPDRTFRDLEKKTRILLEFKPFTENKRGILTGLGQCIAYLNKSHASILVCPSKIKEDQVFMLWEAPGGKGNIEIQLNKTPHQLVYTVYVLCEENNGAGKK